MREMNKQGVLIDVCSQCRGVWLDRGELEKLAGMLPAGTPDYAPPPQQAQTYQPQAPYPSQQQYQGDRRRDFDDDDDDDKHKRYGYGQPHQKSKMKRFLDFFD
jgi:Zn-finger nucleic acid-binding protein